MSVATVRETVNFTNKTNAVTPYTLGQVLASYATQSYVATAISQAVIDPSQIDLSAYAKKTDLPKKLSELTNDANYVQTVGGFIPSNLLPSYVDDVIEAANYASLPNPGESGKIYVTLNNNLTYRWTGSTYTEISKSLALGTTSSTAFRGDYGQTAYNHSQTTGNPHGTTLANLGVTVSAATINYLDGLNANIMTKLGEKLDLAGGTMTGYLTLHHDPTQKMHAANKDYVDKEINGISIAVTQYVTQVTELASDVDGITQTVGTIADTLTTVENDVTGLNQTTSDHTEYISALQTGVSGISSTVSSMHDSVTVLEATVNQLEIEFDTQNLFVVVDSTNKPTSSATYYMNFICKFRGEEIEDYDDITMTLTGSHTGVTATVDKTNKRVSFVVSSATAIASELNEYNLLFQFTSGGFPWRNNKKLYLSTVPKGDTGPQGPKGDTGSSGVSISSIIEYYYKSTSSSETTGGSWTPIYPGWQDGYYIWTKTQVNYSDSTYDETTPICVTGSQGATGTTGPQGTSITAVDVLYYYSDSATSLTGGSWVTTVPSWVDGKYLWTKTRVTYSTGFSDESSPMCVTGSTGETGATGATGSAGKGISTVANYYKATTTQTEPSAASIVDTTIPTLSSTDKYLWQKSITTYTDNTMNTVITLIGTYGDTGAQGQTGQTGASGNGISTMTYYYKTTTTSTQPAASEITSTTMPTLDATNKYLWQKEIITFTQSEAQTTVLLLAVYGDTGQTGAQGPKGDPGDTGASITWKGSMSVPPSNPQLLWAYYDTDDGVSYVWDGTQWQTMAQDGDDGSPGAPGTTYYYHTVYCNNTTTGDGYSTSGGTQLYLGTYSDTTVTDASTFQEATNKGVKWVYTKGNAGDNNIVTSDTEPQNPTQDLLWVDISTGLLKRYTINGQGEGVWEVVNDVQSQLEDMPDNIKSALTPIITAEVTAQQSTWQQTWQEKESNFIQTDDELYMAFKEANIIKRLTDAETGLETEVTTRESMIRFEDGDIKLGKSDSEYTLKISNDRIELLKGDTIISTWVKTTFRVPKLEIKGEGTNWTNHKFVFIANTDGSVSIRREEEV